MTTRSRRATPVAVPPEPRSIPPRSPVPVSRPLVGPIVVVCGNFQQELRSGSLLVGRIPECDIMVEDALVSRTHARIWLEAGGVRLEDLHSTNGVYLNGDRILHAVSLNVGDRALVGTHELSFAELGTDRAPRLSTPLLPEPVEELADTRSTPSTPMGAEPAPIPITARADALEMLGTLARRLANEQKAAQAPRMLGPHLKGILSGASSGLVVPEPLSELASEYAVDLAHWTADAGWLDYIVELHLVTNRLMSTPVLAALQRAERWIGAMNRPLLEYYLASFAGRSKQFSSAEKTRLGVLQRLVKKR